MIKKIPVDRLRTGMYIHDLNCGWMDHPFLHNRFMVDDAATLNRILRAGIAEVHIDTSLGKDVGVAEVYIDTSPGKDAAVAETDAAQSGEIEKPLCEPSAILPDIISRLSPVEEFNRARELYFNASKLMQSMMKDVRLGRQVEMEQCEPIVDGIIESMFRQPSALLPLAQMKTIDEYTFQHSVSVAALAVAFGRVLDMQRDEIKALSLGGLLHDVGKAKVPGRILNKSGKLDHRELEVMKSHVSETAGLLKDIKGVSEITFNAAAQHHERYDGTGYPRGLKGDQISLHGQMLAIVDVYDAITSLRVYHKGVPPTDALRRIFEWSGTYFNSTLVQAFIKGIGIYPAGSLVRMESERLGVVREVVPDKLLQPIVQLIYDCRNMCHIVPEMVSLATSNDKIKSHESFEKWGIDQSRWVMNA